MLLARIEYGRVFIAGYHGDHTKVQKQCQRIFFSSLRIILINACFRALDVLLNLMALDMVIEPQVPLGAFNSAIICVVSKS